MHETARCLFNILSWLSHRLIKYNSLFLSSFIKLHFIVLLIYLINSEQLALDFTNMRNPVLNIFLTYLSILDSYLIGINLTIGASSSNFYQYVSIYQFVSMCINKCWYILSECTPNLGLLYISSQIVCDLTTSYT